MAAITARLHPDQRNEVRDLIAAAEAADGVAPLSEYKTMGLDRGLGVREHVVLDEHGTIVAYGQAAWHGRGDADGHWAIEIVAAAAYRQPSVVVPLVELMDDDLGGSRVTLWARTDYAAAAARASGWQRDRVLWEMRRPLPIRDLDTDVGDIRVSTFRMGVDESAWLRVNNAVFAGHPENGNMTRRDLEARMAQPWFDPEGFFLAWSDEELVASCWTKLHRDGVGEIYIIGVAPGWEGMGLGKSLVAIGLEHLGRRRHARHGLLFVEASNERATRLYRQLGFEVAGEVAAYSPKT